MLKPEYDVEVIDSLIYAHHGGRDLKAAFYRPPKADLAPLLITLPGGGWRICDRGHHQKWGHYLASRGIAVLTLEYRTATFEQKAFPEALDDVLAGIRFAQDRAEELRVDIRRVALLGTSAGGHLASLAALTSNIELKALVSVYGVYDLFTCWQDVLKSNPRHQDNNVRNFLGADPYEDHQVYFDASSLRAVRYQKNRLPVLLSWGTHDDAVSPQQSEGFLTALTQAGFTVRTHRIVGASHWWFSQDPDDSSSYAGQLAPRLLEFLSTNL